MNLKFCKEFIQWVFKNVFKLEDLAVSLLLICIGARKYIIYLHDKIIHI